jgi:hypothetical protein
MVEFFIGTQKIGSATLSNGKAYLHTSALPVGMNPVNASYVGDDVFAPSASNAITVKVLGPDFTVQATPSTVTVAAGQSITVNLLVTPKNGFNQTPAFACGGLPAGSSCSFGAPVKETDGALEVGMTIQAGAQAASQEPPGSQFQFGALAFLPLLFWVAPKRLRRFRSMLLLSVGFAVILVVGGSAIACGGRPASTSNHNATTSNTTDVTVTAHTASGLSHTAVVKLVLD